MNGCNNYFELKFVEEIAAIIMAGFLLIVIICMMIKDWLQQKSIKSDLERENKMWINQSVCEYCHPYSISYINAAGETVVDDCMLAFKNQFKKVYWVGRTLDSFNDMDEKLGEIPMGYPICIVATSQGFYMVSDYQDLGTQFTRINFCPWCGRQLLIKRDGENAKRK